VWGCLGYVKSVFVFHIKTLLYWAGYTLMRTKMPADPQVSRTGMIPRRRFLKGCAVALLILAFLPSVNLLAVGSAASNSEVWANFSSQDQLQYLPQLQGKVTTIVWYGADQLSERSYLKSVVSTIHSYGFKVISAIDALRSVNSWMAYTGYDSVQLDPKWCQYDSTSKASYILSEGGFTSKLPCGGGGTEAWFSPLGPFTFRVTIPRVNYIINSSFDGIFLMSFNLWRDDGASSGGACGNPEYTMPVRNNVYSGIQDWQNFRKVQVTDMASRIAQSASSSGLKVWYSDDNIYMRGWSDVVKLRERFAVNLNGMQPFSDGFVFEWLGTPEDNAAAAGLTYQQEIDSAVQCIKNARQNDGLNKPITLIAMTGRQDVYNYLVQKAGENNFNIWTSWRFLAGLKTPPYA
jgi:hypothetical protein